MIAWLSARKPWPGISSSGMRPFGFFARNSAVRVSPRLMSSSTSSYGSPSWRSTSRTL